MDRVIEYLKTKSKILYDLNCIEKYIQEGQYDINLKEVWDEYQSELLDLDLKINEIKAPRVEEFKEKRLEILEKIHSKKQEISELKLQLNELDQWIRALKD